MASHSARVPNAHSVASVARLTAETAATVQMRFDQLEDRLFGEAKLDPGILVRMDDRLTRLEGNPAIVAGRMARGIVSGLIVVGSIIYGFSHINDIATFLQTVFRHR